MNDLHKFFLSYLSKNSLKMYFKLVRCKNAKTNFTNVTFNLKGLWLQIFEKELNPLCRGYRMHPRMNNE